MLIPPSPRVVVMVISQQVQSKQNSPTPRSSPQKSRNTSSTHPSVTSQMIQTYKSSWTKDVEADGWEKFTLAGFEKGSGENPKEWSKVHKW